MKPWMSIVLPSLIKSPICLVPRWWDDSTALCVHNNVSRALVYIHPVYRDVVHYWSSWCGYSFIHRKDSTGTFLTWASGRTTTLPAESLTLLQLMVFTSIPSRSDNSILAGRKSVSLCLLDDALVGSLQIVINNAPQEFRQCVLHLIRALVVQSSGGTLGTYVYQKDFILSRASPILKLASVTVLPTLFFCLRIPLF